MDHVQNPVPFAFDFHLVLEILLEPVASLRPIDPRKPQNHRRKFLAPRRLDQDSLRLKQHLCCLRQRFRQAAFRHHRAIALPIHAGATGINKLLWRRRRQPRDQVPHPLQINRAILVHPSFRRGHAIDHPIIAGRKFCQLSLLGNIPRQRAYPRRSHRRRRIRAPAQPEHLMASVDKLNSERKANVPTSNNQNSHKCMIIVDVLIEPHFVPPKYLPSAICHRLFAIGYWLFAIGYRILTICNLPSAICHLRAHPRPPCVSLSHRIGQAPSGAPCL